MPILVKEKYGELALSFEGYIYCSLGRAVKLRRNKYIIVSKLGGNYVCNSSKTAMLLWGSDRRQKYIPLHLFIKHGLYVEDWADTAKKAETVTWKLIFSGKKSSKR